MNNLVYLSQPAMVSNLGVGVSAHLQALFGERQNYFSQETHWFVNGKSLQVGRVPMILRAFPSGLPEVFCSRNNQLLWHALAQIEDIIQKTIDKYGKNRVAVVLGTSTSGGDENEAAFTHFVKNNSWGKNSFSQQKQLLCAPADFVKKIYGLTSIAYGISTACTSGSRALISAARLLRLGVCDAVICGGVDTLSKLTINGFNSLEVLSVSACQPFMSERDGINIGEAAAVFVMTCNSSDGLPLLGYGASSDAYHMSSPRPDAMGAKMAISQVLEQAHLLPQDIDWINLHGTGTIQNDAMEAHAIHDIFGNTVSSASTKGLTGHTLGAAGALEAAILWAVLNRNSNGEGQLPPHRAIGHYDAALPLIHLTHRDEFFKNKRRIALSTSFAFGGNNTALIIGDNCENTN